MTGHATVDRAILESSFEKWDTQGEASSCRRDYSSSIQEPLMKRQIILILTLFAAGEQLALGADNWPQWRGPAGTGVAADGEYPTEFSAEEGLAWKVALPGLGASTPAVWGNQIFVTCGIDGKDGVVCYGMDGREQWRKTFGKEREGKHAKGTGSNPSPVTNGQHLVVYYKSGTVACLDLRGNIKWDENLQKAYGKDTLWHDLGTSPVLAGGRAIVAVVQEGPSYLVALDLSNGKVAWKTEREYDNPQEADQAYTTPQVVQIEGKDIVVTWGADHLTGHDATTGKLLWECGGFNPKNEGYWRVIASATIGDGIAVVPWGRGKFLTGVRVGGKGDITKSNTLWQKDGLGADVPTAVVRNGKAYLLTDAGRIACLDLKSGNELWTFDLPKNRNKYYASPVLAGETLYCTREDGVVYVGQVSDEGYQQLAENNMGQRLIATPVPVRDSLLVRGDTDLFRIGPSDAARANTGGGN
jgi:outer membrane protein assembly factor BamB